MRLREQRLTRGVSNLDLHWRDPGNDTLSYSVRTEKSQLISEHVLRRTFAL